MIATLVAFLQVAEAWTVWTADAYPSAKCADVELAGDLNVGHFGEVDDDTKSCKWWKDDKNKAEFPAGMQLDSKLGKLLLQENSDKYGLIDVKTPCWKGIDAKSVSDNALYCCNEKTIWRQADTDGKWNKCTIYQSSTWTKWTG